jgi:hypothetical protein
MGSVFLFGFMSFCNVLSDFLDGHFSYVNNSVRGPGNCARLTVKALLTKMDPPIPKRGPLTVKDVKTTLPIAGGGGETQWNFA